MLFSLYAQWTSPASYFPYMRIFSLVLCHRLKRERQKHRRRGRGKEAKTRRERRGNGEKEDLCEVIIPNCSLSFVFKSHLEREKKQKGNAIIEEYYSVLLILPRQRLVGAELEILKDTWGLKQMESLSSVLAYKARLKVSAIMQYSSHHSLHLHKIRVLSTNSRQSLTFHIELLPGYGKNQKWTFEALQVLLGIY